MKDSVKKVLTTIGAIYVSLLFMGLIYFSFLGIFVGTEGSERQVILIAIFAGLFALPIVIFELIHTAITD